MKKRELADMAVFGGVSAFEEKLHIGRPNIGEKQLFQQYVENILDSRWLTNNGPYVQSFEHEIEILTGVKHCVAVANATVGLEIAIRALGMRGEVILPSLTFIATAHVLQWLGITPVFCDINPFTLNLDPCQVEELITPETTGIVGVHLWGRPCAIEPLAEIAQTHNLNLLFDAAHALGCSHQAQMVGNFGDAEVFSFHATKVCNSFEGGAIVTNDDELANTLRQMRNFGFVGLDNVAEVGVNGKMSEISAAMGLTSLASLNSFIKINHQNYRCYQQELADLPGIEFVVYDEMEQNNYHYIVLLIDETITGISRDQLICILQNENVLARRYFYPGCHRMEPYRTLQPYVGDRLPCTEKTVQQTLCLPTGTTISTEDIERICQIIRFSLENATKIRSKLSNALPTFLHMV